MANVSGMMFCVCNILPAEIGGKSILEVGSANINGSIRPYIGLHAPASYVGVDIEAGEGVDLVCMGEELVTQFGENRFDLVVATELLEHVENWKAVISNMKRVCKTDGCIVITTRSKGFPFHAYPHDYWRFEMDDMREIFADMQIEKLISDPEVATPGVFIKLRKPADFSERTLDELSLYSMPLGRKVASTVVSASRFQLLRYRLRVNIRATCKRIFNALLPPS